MGLMTSLHDPYEMGYKRAASTDTMGTNKVT